MKFSCRIEDLEVRSCNHQLLQSEPHTTAEIVRWSKADTCHTIAYWILTNAGLDLRFCGSEPFRENHIHFMKLAEMGQDFLTNYVGYDAEEN